MPRLIHPARDHLLFSGPLLAASEIGDLNGIWPQSPNLFWPADRPEVVARLAGITKGYLSMLEAGKRGFNPVRK